MARVNPLTMRLPRAFVAGLAVLALLALPRQARARAGQLSATGSAGLAFNDNITLSREDVNFGPGVLAAQDLLGVIRLRAAYHRDGTNLIYTGSRTHFFKNTDLGFIENAVELEQERLIDKKLLIRGQGLLAKVDPDIRVSAVNGAFPFTTSEPPDRQIAQLVISTPRGAKTEVALRGLAQGQQYTNDPLLDSRAWAAQLRLGRALDKQWTVAGEVQAVGRDYTNLVGPVPSSIVETHAPNAALQVSFVPNAHFGFLGKVLALDQRSNVDAFFLNQRDVSLGATYVQDKWGSASLLLQHSNRDFALRPVAGGGSQLDHDLLLVFLLNKKITPRDVATFGYTRDRNHSNDINFDYSNNIVRLEISHVF